MRHFTLRAVVVSTALTGISLLTLGACADEPLSPALERASAATPALADSVITVTNTKGDTSTGSLRWAIGQADDYDTIRFDPAIGGGTIVLDTMITVHKALTYVGPPDKGITISGAGRHRLFRIGLQSVEKKPTVFRNVTLRDGKAPSGEQGGAIWSNSILVLENSTVTANSAQHISALSAFELRLVNSTVSGNVVMDVAEPYPAAQADRMTLINSTIANNSKRGVRGVTTLVLQNSLLAGNGSENCGSAGTMTVDGAVVSDDASCGTGATVAEPKLLPLAANGGPTMTHALGIGSAAVDAGRFCTVAVDQRYVERGAACDVGAYEFTDYTTVSLTVDPGMMVNPVTGWAVVTGSVACSRDEKLDVRVDLTQAIKGRSSASVDATATAAIDCGAAARPWSVALAPSTGAFTNGSATATAKTIGTQPWVSAAAVSSGVKLFWSHR